MFDYLSSRNNAVDTVLMSNIGAECQFVSRAVCADAYDFRKRPGCVLTGACALMRRKMVYARINLLHSTHFYITSLFKNQACTQII